MTEKHKIAMYSGVPFGRYGNQSLYRFVAMFTTRGYDVELFYASAVDDTDENDVAIDGLTAIRLPSLACGTFSRLRKIFSRGKRNGNSVAAAVPFFDGIKSSDVIPPFGNHNVRNAAAKWLFWCLAIIDNLLIYAWFRFFKPKAFCACQAIVGYEVHYTLAAKWLARAFGKTYINKFQGTALKATNRNLSLCRKYYPSLYYGINDADLSIMVNDGTDGEYYQKIRGCRNTLFITHGVRENYPEDKDVFSDTDDKLLLFNNASSSIWKRVDRIIRALALIDPQILAHIRLYTTYHGPYAELLPRLASKYEVEKNVVFLNRVDNATCFSMIKKCDCLIMTNDMSNLGNPVLEAARMGKAIISLNDGSLDVLKIEGELFPVLIDIEQNMDAALADSIMAIYSMKLNGLLEAKFRYQNIYSLSDQQSREFSRIQQVIE